MYFVRVGWAEFVRGMVGKTGRYSDPRAKAHTLMTQGRVGCDDPLDVAGYRGYAAILCMTDDGLGTNTYIVAAPAFALGMVRG
jgi:hypothetical protein